MEYNLGTQVIGDPVHGYIELTDLEMIFFTFLR